MKKPLTQKGRAHLQGRLRQVLSLKVAMTSMTNGGICEHVLSLMSKDSVSKDQKKGSNVKGSKERIICQRIKCQGTDVKGIELSVKGIPKRT